jgi:flagellar biosynthesis protein FliQ
MFLVLIAAGPWMLALIVDYLQRILIRIGTVVS